MRADSWKNERQNWSHILLKTAKGLVGPVPQLDTAMYVVVD